MFAPGHPVIKNIALKVTTNCNFLNPFPLYNRCGRVMADYITCHYLSGTIESRNNLQVSTGCPGANIYVSICPDRQKYASQIWFQGSLGFLSSGHLTYDPSILLKVLSLSSTASNRKGAKKSIKLKIHPTLRDQDMSFWCQI